MSIMVDMTSVIDMDSDKKAVSSNKVISTVGHLLYLTQNNDSKGGVDTIHKAFHWRNKVFLPSKTKILVQNAVTGAVEQTLNIDSNNSNNHTIECACLVEEQQVIIASLSDATLVEWSISSTTDTTITSFLLPRRVFHLPKFYENPEQLQHVHPRFLHLASCSSNTTNNTSHNNKSEGATANKSIFIYAILQPCAKFAKCKLVQIKIPIFHLKENNNNNDSSTAPTTIEIDSFRTISIDIPGCSTETHNSDENNNTSFPLSLHCFYCNAISGKQKLTMMLAIVTKYTILFCYDNNNNNNAAEQDYRFVAFTPVAIENIKRNVFISCVTFQTNTANNKNNNNNKDTATSMQADMAIGYSNGKINVLYNFFDTLPHLFQYDTTARIANLTDEDLLHSTSKIVVKTMHWHVHPVLTMVFYSPTLLISAGEEAVVATWSLFVQQQSTMNKPTHTLPRLTKGDILLLLPASSSSGNNTNNGIVVIGRDNTLQFISIPEYRTKWHLQGIASRSGEHSSHTCVVKDASSSVIMKMDPNTAMPTCANLPGAPGCLQWYNNCFHDDTNHSSLVVSTVQTQLCVAAYNRVSRTDRDGPANLVTSRVTQFAISQDGLTLLTVDVTLLQLAVATVGQSVLSVDNDTTAETTALNQVTTLKFWSSSSTTNIAKPSIGENAPPYQLNALILHPHGRSASVDGLIVSNNGNVGVTASVHENCFRVWKQEQRQDSSVTWKCVFHLPTPAGINPPSGPMAFSPDDSLIAVANGNVVTVWDHEQSALLRSMCCFDSSLMLKVKELYMDEAGRIVVTSNKKTAAIECHSIFSQKTTSTKVWEWRDYGTNTMKSSKEDIISLNSTYLSTTREFAIAVSYYGSNDNDKQKERASSTTKVYYIDALTGVQKTENDSTLLTILGTVQSICSNDESVLLWMDTCELLRVHRGPLPPTKNNKQQLVEHARSNNKAALGLLLLEDSSVKRKRPVVIISSTFDDDDTMLPKKRQTIVEGFGIGKILNSELPRLSGPFIRDYVGQRLQKLA